ncbi:MAG TPA: 4'-phosphopantetheinyl transferase superfamily protein, partial [Micromonospora sp.]
AAVVADARLVRTVGIDAEVDGPLPHRVIDKVAVDAERDWIAGAPAGTHWDKLLFSAKESVYKAWFPLTGRWLGFEDAQVSFDPDAATFQARLLVPPPVVDGRELTGFHGRFLVRDGLVVTAIVESRQ